MFKRVCFLFVGILFRNYFLDEAKVVFEKLSKELIIFKQILLC